MVLDDSSSSDSTTLDPSTNTDTWDSPDLSSRYASVFPLKINRQYLQRPNPFLLWVGFAGPWNWERTVMYRLSAQLETVKGLLRRDPTQPEVDALVEYTSREVNTRRIGLPIGVTAGSVHAYYTLRKKLSIPSELSFLEGLKVAWRLSPVLERRQAALQAGLRFGVWVIFTLGNFIALSSDPRLAEFRDAVRRYAEARMQRMEGYKEKTKQRREQRDAARHEGTTVSAEEPEENYKAESTEGTTDDQSHSSPSPSYQTPPRSYETTRSYVPEESPSSDFFDDASPTVPEYQASTASPSRPTPASNENAWDRIRRETASHASISAPSPSSWGRQQPSASSEYSSYESEQQNGQREREAAQRQFDRMLDSERQLSQDGGDDNSNKKGWRRW
ncbi:endo-1,3(4)-beta-glucanase, putative [Talaromyces stipitatus ATCC 10500]|uniref:Endo-1,3(4)-beta-glucanase, putative n=1 Tax=Talaromyces stipitatus (strain ATCC 10500 / CBS 375.48 / QM 6759 / NRRL 1006) TaxID=441959 RepID=B8MQ58_TALSN|nr:endo-1,3(4)-beta-glucanase, putative [Talaromyces stipitatus ATCC 10500]EED13084.1 endo-1,3(4)-beta-glucanase, putative [Talaromyces stipitatus ATCC 10500]